MSTAPPPTIAFFGATGGCASSALVLALKAGYKATALARTPAKLRTLLLSAPHNLPEQLLEHSLTIIPGSATDAAAVRATLTVPANPTQAAGTGAKYLATAIISGIGSAPAFSLKNPLFPVTLKDPHICETAAVAVVGALRDLLAEGYVVPPPPSTSNPLFADQTGRPRILVVSTTGISAGGRDVPRALMPVYRWLLDVPHKDKAAMEKIVFAARQEGVFGGVVVVRPTLLANGTGRGLGSVRVGWEDESGKGPGPAVGYRIARADVGAWIWEEGVLKGGEWGGRCVSLTW